MKRLTPCEQRIVERLRAGHLPKSETDQVNYSINSLRVQIHALRKKGFEIVSESAYRLVAEPKS